MCKISSITYCMASIPFRVSHELHGVCPAYNGYFHINCTTFDRHTILSHELHNAWPAYNLYFHIKYTTFGQHTIYAFTWIAQCTAGIQFILSHQLHDVWPAYNIYFHMNCTMHGRHTIYTFTSITRCLASIQYILSHEFTLFGQHTMDTFTSTARCLTGIQYMLPHELHGVWSAYNLSCHINYTVRGWCTIYLLTWITHHKKLPQCLFEIQNPVPLQEVALYRDA
jgi:hypothetical protein